MKKNFTLIELLAVIFIIMLLMGLAAKGIPMAMERGRITQCASNLRDIGLASTAFYNDKEVYPFGFNEYEDEDTGETITIGCESAVKLASELSEYLDGSKDTWICPSVKKRFGGSGNSYIIRTDSIEAKDMNHNQPVVKDKAGNHTKPNRTNVLYGNGRVKVSDGNGPSTGKWSTN